MARSRKKQEETPLTEVGPDLTEPSRGIVDRKDNNVVPFTGGEQDNQPAAESYNPAVIDQFLVGYGIQIG
ncbi:MAG: hypothetical protein MUC48_04990 [Leptolyngbya sp. Prado105]|jgi:hypothetical protein|nr:hypothetical protein [Leptolyngbya sp. Prado105]